MAIRCASVSRVARECLAVRTRLLNRVVTQIYDDALRPLGLKVSQMNVLVLVESLGSARPAEIGRWLEIDASTLSRNLARMKRRGWLAEAPDEDQRSRPCRLTSKGRSLLERAIPRWEQAQDRARDVLGPDAAKALSRFAPGGR